MRLSALALLVLGTPLMGVGCAHRGLSMPGPTRDLGKTPRRYADRFEAPEGEAGAQVASAGSDKPSPVKEPRRRRRGGGDGEAVARAAADLVGESRLTAHGEVYRNDCSGMVEAAYARAGTQLSGSSKDLYELAMDRGLLHSHKLPRVGDVAFFDDTYDRNGNGRRDDELTHVAVVESIGDDGTIVMVHKGCRGVTRINMNLKRPDDRRDEAGNPLNDYLRARSRRDSGPTLTGQLWRAFGSLWALPDEDRAVADSD